MKRPLDRPLIPFRIGTLTTYGHEFFKEWIEFHDRGKSNFPDNVFCEEILGFRPPINPKYKQLRFQIGDMFEERSIYVLCELVKT